MKRVIVLLLLFISFTFASENNEDNTREQKNIKKQLEKEKKYALEQQFYKGKDYDLKAAEVDEETVKAMPETPNTNEDFDMDSVYD